MRESLDVRLTLFIPACQTARYICAARGVRHKYPCTSGGRRMRDNRTTIRNLDPRAMDQLRSIARHTDMKVGEAVSEAIRFWISVRSVGIAPGTESTRMDRR